MVVREREKKEKIISLPGLSQCSEIMKRNVQQLHERVHRWWGWQLIDRFICLDNC